MKKAGCSRVPFSLPKTKGPADPVDVREPIRPQANPLAGITEPRQGIADLEPALGRRRRVLDLRQQFLDVTGIGGLVYIGWRFCGARQVTFDRRDQIPPFFGFGVTVPACEIGGLDVFKTNRRSDIIELERNQAAAIAPPGLPSATASSR